LRWLATTTYYELMTEPDLQRITSKIRAAMPEVRLVYLFGSEARGYARADSDIDIAFWAIKPMDSVKRWNLEQEIASIFNRDVDLVDLAAVGDLLRKEVVDHGIRLFGDPHEAMLFEIRVVKDYQDYKIRVKGIEADILARTAP
jgi:predicted nucleotidyltransferase